MKPATALIYTNLALSSADVVLIEGTVALALEVPETAEVHRYHVDIDEGLRKERVLREYRLRGFGESQALEVYLGRRADEFPVVEGFAGAAGRVSLAPA